MHRKFERAKAHSARQLLFILFNPDNLIVHNLTGFLCNCKPCEFDSLNIHT